MILRFVRTSLLLIACLGATARPCAAADVPRVSASSAENDGWGVRKLLSRFRTRSGVVQVGTACMVLALFILTRKFADPPANEEDH